MRSSAPVPVDQQQALCAAFGNAGAAVPQLKEPYKVFKGAVWSAIFTYSYSAFGNTRLHSGSLSNEILFAGQRTDAETGLQYLRARTYDPSSGTFLQRDTHGGQDQLSQSQNRYLYAQGDPFNRVDPSGYCDDSPWGKIGCGWDTLTQGAGNLAHTVYEQWKDVPSRSWSSVVDTWNLAAKYVPPIAAVAIPIGLCIAGVAFANPELCLPAVGLGVYTFSNALNNISHGDINITDKWSWQDAMMTEAATTVAGELAPEVIGAVETSGFAIGLGFTFAAGSDLIDQVVRGQPISINHAGCQGIAGVYGAAKLIGQGWNAVRAGFIWSLATTAVGNLACSGVK
jgi:RHS repeat-associated protein